MSNLFSAKLLKPEPYSTNPVYHKFLIIGCPYCINPGRKKNFKTLWCLYMHFKTHHKNEANYEKKIIQLAQLVIEGVLL